MGNFLKKYIIYILVFTIFFSITILLFKENSHSIIKKEDIKGIEQIFRDILPKEALELLEHRDDILLIDVRTKEEFENERIPNSFRETDFENLEKDSAYILYCRTDNRSGKALNEMKLLGFNEVYNLKGGIEKWKDEGFEVIN